MYCDLNMLIGIYLCVQDIVFCSFPDPNREYKPKVKQWLYRKIFLDEFKTFEYNACKRHIGDLRRSIESVMIQKKKKAPKPKPPAPPPPQQQQVSLVTAVRDPTHYSFNHFFFI